jgi:hypothetical protein
MKKIDNKSSKLRTINDTFANEIARVEVVVTMVEEVEMDEPLDEPLFNTMVVVDVVVVEIWAMGSSVMDGDRIGLWQLQESVLIREWHEEVHPAQHFIVETDG